MKFSSVTERDRKVEKVVITILAFYGWIISALLIKALFGAHAGEDTLNLIKYSLYGVMLIFIINLNTTIKLFRVFGSKLLPKWVDTIVYDPERSPIAGIPILGRFVSNIWVQLLFSIIISSLMVILLSGALQTSLPPNFSTQIGLEKVQLVQQQIFPAGALALAVEPASTAETLDIIAFISILLMALNYGWQNDITIFKNKAVYLILLLLMIPLLGGGWHYIDHLLRYGAEQTALAQTFIFGWISSLITVITFSVIPAIIYHQMNNGIGASLEIFSKNISNVQTILIVGWVLTSILAIIALLKAKDVNYKEAYPSNLLGT